MGYGSWATWRWSKWSGGGDRVLGLVGGEPRRRDLSMEVNRVGGRYDSWFRASLEAIQVLEVIAVA